MAGNNKFYPFATGGGANVVTDAAYALLTVLSTGYQSGVAISEQLNKTWRQSSVMAAVMGQLIANAGYDATDSDGTTTLATRLYQALVGQLNAATTLTGTTTLTVDKTGGIFGLSSSSAFTVTLPVASTCLPGQSFWFTNNGTGTVTISRQSTNTIVFGASSGNTMTLKTGDTLYLVCTGTGGWKAFGGSVLAAYGATIPPGLGVDQTWQDFTSSRAMNSTFTNSTGRPIMVAVSHWTYDAGAPGYFYVNGVQVDELYSIGGDGANTLLCHYVVVPNGATYQCQGATLVRWTELRA